MLKAGNAQKRDVRLIKPWLYKGALVLLAVAVLSIIIFPYAIPSLLGRLRASPTVSLSAPPLKPSISSGPIMGTPAQLVEDLKDIGFDLASAKFTKPELLKDATAEALTIGHSYTFQNGSLILVDSTGELRSVDLDSPSLLTSKNDSSKVVNKTPISLGSVGMLLGNDKDAALTRYGRAFASVHNGSFTFMKYCILIGEKDSKLWNVYFQLDSAMNIEGIGVDSGANKLFRVRLVKDKGVYIASGDGAILYNDLMECGLSLGLPCTNTQRLHGAKTSSRGRGGTAYEFANATIIADTKTLSIASFMIEDNGNFAIENVKRSLLGIARGEGTFNGGRLIDIYRRGSQVVTQRYGNDKVLPSGSPSDTFLKYDLILDDGTIPRHAYLSFTFKGGYAPGLLGYVDTTTPLFIMPSAS